MNNKNLLQEINQLKNPKRWNQNNKIKSYVAVVLLKGKPQPKNKVNKFNNLKLKEEPGIIKIQLSGQKINKKNKKLC